MAAAQKPCHHGMHCIKFDCTFNHPRGRREVCRFREKCNAKGCIRLHPECRFGIRCRGLKNGNCPLYHKGADSVPRQGNSASSARRRHGASEAKGEELSGLLYLKGRSPVYFVAAIDTSSSMNESISTAVEGLESAVSLLQKGDLYGCFIFADDVTMLHPALPIQKVDMKRDRKAIIDKVGGMTALYDAIDHGLDELRRSVSQIIKQGGKPKLFHLIVTDGEDNRSKVDKEELKRKIDDPKVPNYHLVVLGIGGGSFRDIESFCKSTGKSTFFHVKDMGELKGWMESIMGTAVMVPFNGMKDLGRLAKEVKRNMKMK